MSGVDLAFLFAAFMSLLAGICGFCMGWTACEFRHARQRKR